MAAPDRAVDRSDLRPAGDVLSVHAARLAAGRRMAHDAHASSSVASRCGMAVLIGQRPHDQTPSARPNRFRTCAPSRSPLPPCCVLFALQLYLGQFERMFQRTTRSSTASPTPTRTSASRACTSSRAPSLLGAIVAAVNALTVRQATLARRRDRAGDGLLPRRQRRRLVRRRLRRQAERAGPRDALHPAQHQR